MTKRHFHLKTFTNAELAHQQHLDEKRENVWLGLILTLLFLAGVVLAVIVFGLDSKKSSNVHTVTAEPLGVMIDRVSTEVGIHPAMGHAIVEEESSKNRNAVSSTGAIGLTQVLWSTAKGEGVKTLTDLTMPETNLRVGFKYLKKQKETFKTWYSALLAYKVGPGAVKRGHKATKEDLRYINNILAKCKNVLKET